MSFTIKDRNFQSGVGNSVPVGDASGPLGSGRLAAIIADALKREFGGTNSAAKTVASLTHANGRAVKNWFDGKNGPGGPHLVALMRHSDAVLEALLLLAGRQQLLTAKKFSDARRILREMLQLADDLQDP